MGFPYKLYRQWRAKNEFIFTAFITQQGELIGFADVFPLKAAVGRKLACGDLAEDELSIDDIYGQERSDAADYIYIASIVCCVRNELAQTAVLAATIQYVQDLYPPRPGRTYAAIGSTKDGRRVLSDWGSIRSSRRRSAREERQCSSFAARTLRRTCEWRSIQMPSSKLA
jgi:hypothetical protein